MSVVAGVVNVALSTASFAETSPAVQGLHLPAALQVCTVITMFSCCLLLFYEYNVVKTLLCSLRQGESMSSKRIRASDSTRALARVESDARIRVCELFL